MTKEHRIITHDGKFHADEVLAVATLKLALDGESVTVVRSRDPQVIATGDYVVDVGHAYDPEHHRYDHHQKDGAGIRDNGIPYASFGLVWKHLGERICGSKSVADEVESVVVLPIDAADNGVSIIERAHKEVSPYDFHDAIDIFNPHVSEPLTHDEQFLKVVEIAQVVIEREIIKARLRQEDDQYVRGIYEQTEDKRLIILGRPANTRFLGTMPEPLFYVLPGTDDGRWIVHGIRVDREFFTYRSYFPEAWGGKRDGELAETTGVPDAIFCHNARFITVAGSKEGALKLAELALES